MARLVALILINGFELAWNKGGGSLSRIGAAISPTFNAVYDRYFPSDAPAIAAGRFGS